jgi:hypothetical protein
MMSQPSPGSVAHKASADEEKDVEKLKYSTNQTVTVFLHKKVVRIHNGLITCVME